jgi:hypothetical protein
MSGDPRRATLATRSDTRPATRYNPTLHTPLPTSVNSDIDWDSFNSDWYQDHNYRTLRDDDRKIVELIRDFFADAKIADGRGVDVGSGANLYPAMAMLPFCAKLELREFGASNVAWLTEQIDKFDSSWDDFWAVYRESRAYEAVEDPRTRLAEIATVTQASIFDLPQGRWDLGTMFFVACSISNDIAEFRRAVHRFVGALTLNAPFAAAFMIKSQGYEVDGRWFPAVAIDADEVRESLDPVAYDVTIQPIETGSPLRDGYGGMLLATGFAARRTTG